MCLKPTGNSLDFRRPDFKTFIFKMKHESLKGDTKSKARQKRPIRHSDPNLELGHYIEIEVKNKVHSFKNYSRGLNVALFSSSKNT